MQALIDIKKEYTTYIQDSFAIPIAEKINNYYDLSINEKTGLKGFQNHLICVKNWNNLIINEESKKIINRSKYKNIETIYKILIITNIKIKIFEFNNKFDDIKNINIISINDFIHKCYNNCCIWAWKNPYLFIKNKNLRESEIQHNYNLIEKNFRKIIKNTITESTPIDDIIDNMGDTLLSSASISLHITSILKISQAIL